MEHVKILNAIEQRDAHASHEAMAQHLRRSRLAIMENLFSGQDVSRAGKRNEVGAR
jgi:DNA-binding GntR family transcriptional regulator